MSFQDVDSIRGGGSPLDSSLDMKSGSALPWPRARTTPNPEERQGQCLAQGMPVVAYTTDLAGWGKPLWEGDTFDHIGTVGAQVTAL